MSGAACVENAVVIGAGLAGSAVACRLARAGLAPLMLERDPQPRHAVCGEFLSIEAQAELARLGVDLDRYGASRITALRLVHDATVAQTKLPFIGRGLSRKVLDEALRGEAIRAGAHLVRGTPVRSLTGGSTRISLDVGRLGEIQARTVFLASGKHDIRGAKRLHGRAKDDFIAFKTYFALPARQRASLDGVVELVLFAGGYAGLQLVEGGQANLCLLVARSRFDRAGRSWEALLAGLCRETPPLAERLAGAAPLLDRPLAIYQIPMVSSTDRGLRMRTACSDSAIKLASSVSDRRWHGDRPPQCAPCGFFLSRKAPREFAFHRQIRTDIRIADPFGRCCADASHWRARSGSLVEACRISDLLRRRPLDPIGGCFGEPRPRRDHADQEAASVAATQLRRDRLDTSRFATFDARAGNRIFALTLLRIWAAYQTGSMRYGLLVARKRCRS